MKRHKDHKDLTALGKGDHNILDKIYKEHLPQIISWVTKNNGSRADAQDIFQEAILALYNKANDSDFILTCPLGAFLFQICKNKWISQLRKNKRMQEVIKDEQGRYKEEWNFTSLLEQIEQEEIRQVGLEKAFSQLSELCQKLLQFVSDGVTPIDIASRLKMAKVNTFYRRKNACIDRWKALYEQENSSQ